MAMDNASIQPVTITAPQPVTITAPAQKRMRLVAKTNQDEAACLGYEPLPICDFQPQGSDDGEFSSCNEDEFLDAMDADLGGSTPTRTYPSSLDIHGGLFLQTDNVLWCMKCGASAKLGATSIYLRELCPGLPRNDSMRQRRKRLIRGVHPTTCKPFVSAPKRVRII